MTYSGVKHFHVLLYCSSRFHLTCIYIYIGIIGFYNYVSLWQFYLCILSLNFEPR